jgi:uncharacterized protein
VPLVIYSIYKDRGPLVREQSREALNFGITALIGYVIASILDAILWGPPLQFLLWVAIAVFAILATTAVNKGENYRYPFALRLVT